MANWSFPDSKSSFKKKKVSVLGLKTNKDLGYMNELFESGKLKFAIDGPYSFEEIPLMIQYFGEGKHKGKIVINV